jgi:hypothetical protein
LDDEESKKKFVEDLRRADLRTGLGEKGVEAQLRLRRLLG